MEFYKDRVSGAALVHLRNFIVQNLYLDNNELKIIRSLLPEYPQATKKIQRVRADKAVDNRFCEFLKLEKEIYKSLDIERSGNELMCFTQRSRKDKLFMEITEKLTNAELKVLELLKQGYSYSECAEKTFTSYTTIRTHVNAIFQKKKVNSLQELLVLELTGKVKGSEIPDGQSPVSEGRNEQQTESERMTVLSTKEFQDTPAADSPPEIKGSASPADAALNLLKHLI